MTPEDLRTLCVALGFTATTLRAGENHKDTARRAILFADLIEDFCNYAPPYAVSANENDGHIDKIIEKLKTGLRDRGEVDLHKNMETLLRIYDRLRGRFMSYANEKLLADRILELLDAEIAHDAPRRPS